MPTRDTKLENELSLSEMLADPIVQAVMARDNISSDEVEGLMHAVKGKRMGDRNGPGRSDRKVSAAKDFTEWRTPPEFPKRLNGG